VLCYLFLLGIVDSADKCPNTTPSETCHVGLRHMCNDDVDCVNGTLCCFTGCRRQCWDPLDRNKATFSKRTNTSLIYCCDVGKHFITAIVNPFDLSALF